MKQCFFYIKFVKVMGLEPMLSQPSRFILSYCTIPPFWSILGSSPKRDSCSRKPLSFHRLLRLLTSFIFTNILTFLMLVKFFVKKFYELIISQVSESTINGLFTNSYCKFNNDALINNCPSAKV